MNAQIGTQAAVTRDQDPGAHDDEEQVVVFRLDQAEFGVPIDSVQEIVRIVGEITRVPKAPTAVEGVINLRGAVLAVLDLRRRLGLPSVERSDRQRIIVFLIDGLRSGFIVDSVTEVLKIPRSNIEMSPRLAGEQNRLLVRMANLEKLKRMIWLLDPVQLTERQELGALAQVAAA